MMKVFKLLISPTSSVTPLNPWYYPYIIYDILAVQKKNTSKPLCFNFCGEWYMNRRVWFGCCENHAKRKMKLAVLNGH